MRTKGVGEDGIHLLFVSNRRTRYANYTRFRRFYFFIIGALTQDDSLGC
jgi:hypothetical protein